MAYRPAGVFRPVFAVGRTGRQAQAVPQPRQDARVQRPGSGQQRAPGGQVRGRVRRTGLGQAGQRELPGRDGGSEVGAQAGQAQGLGGQAAQRRRAQRGEHHVGTLVGRGSDALTQPLEKPDGLRPRLLLRPGRRPRPHQFPGIARQRPVLQPAPADQSGERLVGSQGDLMVRLPQPLPEPGEGRDITPGTGRHDQDPHRDDPTVRPGGNRRPAWRARRAAACHFARAMVLAAFGEYERARHSIAVAESIGLARTYTRETVASGVTPPVDPWLLLRPEAELLAGLRRRAGETPATGPVLRALALTFAAQADRAAGTVARAPWDEAVTA